MAVATAFVDQGCEEAEKQIGALSAIKRCINSFCAALLHTLAEKQNQFGLRQFVDSLLGLRTLIRSERVAKQYKVHGVLLKAALKILLVVSYFGCKPSSFEELLTRRQETRVAAVAKNGRGNGLCCKNPLTRPQAGPWRLGWVMFKRRRLPVEIILLCVRWYCKYGISYRDLVEIMQERGVEVDPSTIMR